MSSPVLAEFDQVTIQNSLGVAAGITALHLVLEQLSPEARRMVKETILTQWKGAWNEAFQSWMNRYIATLNQTTNSDKLDQPEDFQQAFSATMAEAEKSARISLRLNES